MHINTGCCCAIGKLRARFCLEALVKMKCPAGDIADSEMRGIDRWEITPQRLKEDQFKAVVMGFTIDDSIHMSGIIPPLGQVAVRRLVLRKTYWRQRSRCRGCVDDWQLGRSRNCAGKSAG